MGMSNDKSFHGYKLDVGLSADQLRIEAKRQDIHGDIIRQVIDLQDALTRKALIEAGWTPPNLQPEGKRTMYACRECGFLYGGKITRCDCMPKGKEQNFDVWVAYPAKSAPSVLRDVLRCRYPVCTSINPKGYGWDMPRLEEVLDEAVKGSR